MSSNELTRLQVPLRRGVQPGVERQRQRALQLLATLVQPVGQLDHVDHANRRDEHLGLVRRLRRLIAFAPHSRTPARSNPSSTTATRAVGQRELRRPHRLEVATAVFHSLVVARAVALIPGEDAGGRARHLAQPISGRDKVSAPWSPRRRPPRSCRRETRPGPPLSSAARAVGSRPSACRGAAAKWAAARGGRRAAPAGGRPPGSVEHGSTVVGGLGVMGEPRRLAAGERGQRRPMQSEAAVGRELVLDRGTRDLVPEGDGVTLRPQHAGRQACLELRGLVGRDPLEQRQLGARAGDRHGLDEPACRRRRRAARARTASRTLPGVPPSPCASTSVTKNGLPPVRACRAEASTPRGANSATAPAESGETVIRRAAFSWPSTTRSGWSRVNSSSR